MDPLDALRAATKRIAPVWPLDRFVAVNPYLGLQDHDFVDAVARLQHVAGARSTMSELEYWSLIMRGEIDFADLEQAIVEAGSTLTVGEVIRLLETSEHTPRSASVRTVTDVLSESTGVDWSRFSVELLGGFFATYFDTRFASWQPHREGSLFSTWKREAEVDRTPQVMGAKGLRAAIAALPESFDEAARQALTRLEPEPAGLELYLHRLLMRVGGWSAFAARLVWERRRRDGSEDDTLVELLTVLLAFEACLYASMATSREVELWRKVCAETAKLAKRSPRGGPIEARALAQRAYEMGFQRRLVDSINDRLPADSTTASRERAGSVAPRPDAQAVFCIDVRSEVYRRHLEAADSGVETLGFAGFFGFPVEFVPLGHDRGAPQCPVLLEPAYRVGESLGRSERTAVAVERRCDRRSVGRAWQSFKMGAISCFSFVGPIGLSYLPKLFTDGLGLTRPVPHPSVAGLSGRPPERTVDLESTSVPLEGWGIPLEDRIELAAGALRGMSLTRDLARLVLLVAHGSSSTNNPHASGLDCGACGGRSGEANTRVAVDVLNDARVRRGLASRGIEIPEDTVFVAAQHDTTTDEVSIFSRKGVPASHVDELERLERSMQAASGTCRLERARRLRDPHGDQGPDWIRRSRDWAQVRPEWGLAGCAAFVAAPRDRTIDLDLGGRAFLHSYSWEQDEGFDVLELIMTAPMVVASWITLQYYGSAVDPDVFGAGNKTLHNVVGGSLGVLEGNSGDLRVGLPWQSIHDGERLQHEPVRLNVIIEAPITAMNSVIERNASLRQLLDNGWIHLFALTERGRVEERYAGDLSWVEVGRAQVQDEPVAWSRAS